QLLAQPATAATTLKDEARRLAEAMRGLTREAARQVAGAVSSFAGSAEGGSLAAARGAAFHGVTPLLGARVYLAPGSAVIGDVSLGEDVSLWPGVVLRGDVAGIRIGARSNVQDGAVLHVSPQAPCLVGARVTIGHQATVH